MEQQLNEQEVVEAVEPKKASKPRVKKVTETAQQPQEESKVIEQYPNYDFYKIFKDHYTAQQKTWLDYWTQSIKSFWK